VLRIQVVFRMFDPTPLVWLAVLATQACSRTRAIVKAASMGRFFGVSRGLGLWEFAALPRTATHVALARYWPLLGAAA
jgi:hypothetical protein